MESVTVWRYVQALETFARRLEIVFLSFLTYTATKPLQPSAFATPAGRRISPRTV